MSFPITVPHDQVGRILRKHASVLILTRRLRRERRYEIHDSLTVRRNARHRRAGRPDLQSDPRVLAIDVLAVEETTLFGLDLVTVRAAGFPTQRDFYDDWLRRRRRLELDLPVFVHTFLIAEEPRFLAARIHRGYTSDPEHAVLGEGEALGAAEQQEISRAAFERDDRIRREKAKEAAKDFRDPLDKLEELRGHDPSTDRAISAISRAVGMLEASTEVA